MIIHGLTTVKNTSICDESIWPYNVSQYAAKPSLICYKKAIYSKILSYLPVEQNLDSLKYNISQASPIFLGKDVYSSFEADSVNSTGVIPITDTKNEEYLILGGHCITLIGYDDNTKLFYI